MKNRNSIMRFTVTIAFCLIHMALFGQEFTIKFMEQSEQGLSVHYDLIDTTKGHTYTVFVYSSLDNFLSPLQKVSGDHGFEVKPGLNRKVTWNLREELAPTFKGNVELEIRGRLYIPFIRFEGFQDMPVIKRKSPFTVKWSGGTRQNILNFQLYKGDELVHTYPNVPNQFEYELEIPVSVKRGSGYYFRISDTKNRDQVVFTPKFIVKPKIPFILKVLPIAMAGGLAYFLSDKDAGPTDVDEAPLPPKDEN